MMVQMGCQKKKPGVTNRSYFCRLIIETEIEIGAIREAKDKPIVTACPLIKHAISVIVALVPKKTVRF
jgi:hypothetical protein